MPAEIPGFYFDEQRNRYFPIASRPSNTLQVEVEEKKLKPRPHVHKFLFNREISRWSQAFFPRLSMEVSCSQARVWRYKNVYSNESSSDTAIALAHDGYQDVLLHGSSNAILSVTCMHRRSPENSRNEPFHFLPKNKCLWSSTSRPPQLFSDSSSHFDSMISAVCPTSTLSDAIVTTLGEGRNCGSVFLFNTYQYLTQKLWTGRSSIWCAEILPGEAGVSLGGSKSHVYLDLVTRRNLSTSMISDVLSQKIDSTGSMVLCGLRNGFIVTLDRREKYKPRKNVSMGSAVCSLMLLSDDVYLLGSSMKGSIKLWDRRKFTNEVRSFEGHVNSHTMLRMAADPTETFFISGGEDRALRIWSLRSGELLQTLRGFEHPVNTALFHDFGKYAWSAWLGSSNALYCVHGEL